MKCVYLAPLELVLTGIHGAHHVLPCPSDPMQCLIVVEQWATQDAQDAFEAFPTVVPLYPWDADKLAPTALVAGFQDGKVATLDSTDTLGSALWKIRALWPTVRY